MTLQIQQSARYRGRDRWDWSVWLDGPAKELDQVDSVTYYLHPTFPRPVQVKRNREDRFRLASFGWGGFEIKADIAKKSGRVLKRTHVLVLEYPAEESRRRGSADEKPLRARVFLISSAVDQEVASQVSRALETRGFELIDDRSLEPGLPLEEAVRSALSSSRAAIVLLSDFASDSVMMEVDEAQSMGRPIVTVSAGGAEIPRSLRGVQGFRVKDLEEAPRLADELGDRLRRLV